MFYLKEMIRRGVKRLHGDNSGMGVIEVILIIVVLIGLVILFKDSVTELVEGLLDNMTSQANSI